MLSKSLCSRKIYLQQYFHRVWIFYHFFKSAYFQCSSWTLIYISIQLRLNMKLETLSPKINLHVLMLLKMTPYNEIGPHNISQMPGVNIQVSSYKKFEVTHVSKRGILISHFIKGENIGRMEMYLCLPLHTTHSDTKFWSSLIYIQIIAYVKSNDKYTVCWMKMNHVTTPYPSPITSIIPYLCFWSETCTPSPSPSTCMIPYLFDGSATCNPRPSLITSTIPYKMTVPVWWEWDIVLLVSPSLIPTPLSDWIVSPDVSLWLSGLSLLYWKKTRHRKLCSS